jgi:hypothetical protein
MIMSVSSALSASFSPISCSSTEASEESPIKKTSESPSTIDRFTISEVPKEDWASLSREAGNWEKAALLKQREVGRYHPLFSTYCDSSDLCGGIKDELLEPSSDEFDTVIVCKDSDEKIQAIAVHKKDGNTLNTIVSNPTNLKTPSAGGPPSISRGIGAGTAIMLYLVKKTLDSASSRLELYALDNAVGFYKRLSFSGISSSSDPYMQLTKSKIEALVSAGIPPFHLIS